MRGGGAMDMGMTANGNLPSGEVSRGLPSPVCPLSIRLLGNFEVRVEGQALPLVRSRSTEWTLAMLCLQGSVPLSREWLAATLWPKSDGTQALYNLRRALTDLRHALGRYADCLLAPDHRTIRLDFAQADIDLVAFDAALMQGDAASLQHAIQLYRGPLMQGCEETWVIAERARREVEYLDALERLAAHAGSHRDFATATTYLRRALTTDPTRETALRALLEMLAAAGDQASVVVTYRDFRLRLRSELNALPSEETRLLYERLKEGAAGITVVSPALPRSAPISAPDPAGGAVALDSSSYIERAADARFHEALARNDSIVLVKGPRQVGKTSLLARGLAKARQAGCRVVVTDLQKMDREQFLSLETLLFSLARQIAARLELETTPESCWDAQDSPNENFERFLRRFVLNASSVPLLWAMDEVDQVFACPYRNELFGLFRSWHNERALEPEGPWGRLTLAMAYATEAHLFITDLNQSPFNVGTRLTLDDFTEEEVGRLNLHYGSPLPNQSALRRLMGLVGGHPYLACRALQEMLPPAPGALDRFEAIALDDDGPFSDHLRRLLRALRPDAELCHAVREVLAGRPCSGPDAFYRLRSAGVVSGHRPENARLRCGLYARFLEANLL